MWTPTVLFPSDSDFREWLRRRRRKTLNTMQIIPTVIRYDVFAEKTALRSMRTTTGAGEAEQLAGLCAHHGTGTRISRKGIY